MISIERRCPVGHPQVIKVYPLIREDDAFEIFPTLFWLSCPNLIEQISRLEYEGIIKKLETLITEDHAFRERYHQNHRDYIRERWQLLSREDKAFLKAHKLEEVLKQRGIGGIRDWNKVKCLHLQYAHYLARDNVVGRWLAEHFSIRECEGAVRDADALESQEGR